MTFSFPSTSAKTDKVTVSVYNSADDISYMLPQIHQCDILNILTEGFEKKSRCTKVSVPPSFFPEDSQGSHERGTLHTFRSEKCIPCRIFLGKCEEFSIHHRENTHQTKNGFPPSPA